MHAALSPPPTLELRQSKVNPGPPAKLGVFAVEILPMGSKFGPFLGKWAFEPGHHDQAWEVGHFKFEFFTYFIFKGDFRKREKDTNVLLIACIEFVH